MGLIAIYKQLLEELTIVMLNVCNSSYKTQNITALINVASELVYIWYSALLAYKHISILPLTPPKTIYIVVYR